MVASMKKEDFEQLESQRHRNKLDEMNLRYKRQDFNAAKRAWERLSYEEQYERNLGANNDNLVLHATIVFISLLALGFYIFTETNSFVYVGIFSVVALSLFIYLIASGRVKLNRTISYFIGVSLLLFLLGDVFAINISNNYIAITEVVVFLLVVATEYGGGFDKDAAPKFNHTSPEKILTVSIFILLCVLFYQSRKHDENASRNSKEVGVSSTTRSTEKDKEKINDIFKNEHGIRNTINNDNKKEQKINSIFSIDNPKKPQLHTVMSASKNTSSALTNDSSGGAAKHQEEIKNIFSIKSN